MGDGERSAGVDLIARYEQMMNGFQSGESATLCRPFVIGLTGPIASGKSTVLGMLAARGVEVIDADAVYRSLLLPGSELSRRIIARFGPEVITESGDIDRAALGKRVFTDAAALRELDALTHPFVVSAIRHRIASAGADFVAVEAIKLIQSGLGSDIDSLWVVTADERSRLRRLLARSALDEGQVRQRLSAGFDPDMSRAEADVVIDNSGTLEETARQVDHAWRTTLARTRVRESSPPQRVNR
jgi:dephospho-CoA kinase